MGQIIVNNKELNVCKIFSERKYSIICKTSNYFASNAVYKEFMWSLKYRIILYKENNNYNINRDIKSVSKCMLDILC